jgi:hypothetical protein
VTVAGQIKKERLEREIKKENLRTGNCKLKVADRKPKKGRKPWQS